MFGEYAMIPQQYEGLTLYVDDARTMKYEKLSSSTDLKKDMSGIHM